MLNKLILSFAALIFAIPACYSQSISKDTRENWLLAEQKKQFDFLSNFKTRSYFCEVKHAVTMNFNADKKRWSVEYDKKRINKSKFTIIKSDDIKDRIGLCTSTDKPLSSEIYLNKFFCVINEHDHGSTHHKCLLEIDNYNINGNLQDVHTLVCGNGGFKFNLTHGKIFSNDFGIGPQSPYENSLKQSMDVSDCLRF